MNTYINVFETINKASVKIRCNKFSTRIRASVPLLLFSFSTLALSRSLTLTLNSICLKTASSIECHFAHGGNGGPEEKQGGLAFSPPSML